MEKYFNDNAFDGMTNDEFLVNAQLNIMALAFLKQTISQYGLDNVMDVIKEKSDGSFTQSDVHQMIEALNSNSAINELEVEAAKRGIADLKATLAQKNYQFTLKEALQKIKSQRKSNSKKIVTILLVLALAGLAIYYGPKLYVKYVSKAAATTV